MRAEHRQDGCPLEALTRGISESGRNTLLLSILRASWTRRVLSWSANRNPSLLRTLGIRLDYRSAIRAGVSWLTFDTPLVAISTRIRARRPSGNRVTN